MVHRVQFIENVDLTLKTYSIRESMFYFVKPLLLLATKRWLSIVIRARKLITPDINVFVKIYKKFKMETKAKFRCSHEENRWKVCATSTYPCPFCFITLETMRSGESGMAVPCFAEGDASGLQISEECLKLKTFGDIKESYQQFSTLNFDKRFAKTCHSTVNLPLFEESDDMPVIEKALIPELHEIQGIVNHIFFDGLVPLLGRDNALKWPKKFNLIPKHYHGEQFEGNACRRLLKESDALNDKDILQGTPILKITPFIQLLKALDKLVNASFKSERLDEEWRQHLMLVKRIFPATGLSFTLKIHVLLEHLEHGLYFLNGNSLGMWSEQAGESVHREFLKYWSKYQVNNLESDDYCNQLKRAVVEFSSRHL